MNAVRNFLRDRCLKDASGNWVENPGSPKWSEFRRNASTCFPEAFRPQTLLIITHWSPYYLNQLSADERAYLSQVSRLSVKHLEELGYSALENGPDLPLADFADCFHLSESGGAGLAVQVADKVQAIAKRLGYLD